MTFEQSLAIAIVVLMMALFVWNRLRFDIVAALALLAGVLTQIVPAKEAFKGFSDDVVIIVGSALVVSAAVARSGIMEVFVQRLAPFVKSTQAQVTMLVLVVAVMSAIVKNIGALAMMLPIAYQIARRDGKSPSVFLMPMAFASLLGGLVTLVGTSPNVIVARVREELTGQPFSMFDYTPVGLGVAIAGVAFLCVGYRLLPKDRRGAVTLDQVIEVKNYMTEAQVPDTAAVIGRTVMDLKALAEGDVDVSGIVRKSGQPPATPLPDAVIKAGDTLLLRGEPAALARAVSRGGLELEPDHRSTHTQDALDQINASEAVIGPDSILIGQSARGMGLHERYRVNLLAVSRSSVRFRERLGDIPLRAGDVIVLQGDEKLLPDRIREFGLLPLAQREHGLGSAQKRWTTGLVLAATIGLVAFSLVPVAIAFFGAAVALVLFRSISPREAYDAVEWPILVMLAALIPVSDALRTTGTTDLLAGGLASIATGLPAWGAIGLMLVAAMAVTPFLNNAATVLVMAPIAAGFASGLGYRPDPFLMAVAIGAACDFLTPIGHQCNTLVMGPGGYRFTDYPRLGIWLSLIVVAVGVPLLLAFWPVQ